MKFTEEQQRVIDSRNKNVLVAAAAGSGKTAVLVSRIIGLVLDKENPVDIDRILVVTFTNAAAAEMKERIRNALEEELEADPDNDYLNRQMNLIHSAHIMTIDSFCRMVIRDNFDRVGIEPQVRIADESELSIMKEDAIADVMEKFYEEGTEEFLHFLEEFSTQKDDKDVADAVLGLYNFSQSKADPGLWLRTLENAYACENNEELATMPWMMLLVRIASEEISESISELEHALEICESPSGPVTYIDNLNDDIAQFSRLSGIGSYESFRSGLDEIKFGTLSRKKNPDIDPDLRETVKSIRNAVKKRLDTLKNYFKDSPEDILASLKKARPLVKELALLTGSFSERFGEIKEEKNVLDFSDLEHIALNALKTGAGDGYREYFAEVMTDEYQDSNSVQEEILTSVAGDNNYFCVGDVKQSIYAFRLADPSIFMHRYSFSERDEKSERILLSKNFRSRKEVLDSVNAVFRVIMHENIGAVEYDDDAALYPGAAYTENETDHKSEFVLIKGDENEEIGSAEAEAKFTADRIKEMVGSFQVQSLKDGSVRAAEYSDFAILMRSPKNTDEVYAKILEEAGIPVFMESKSGYFQTEEIRTMVSLLTIINNPIDDIALAAVMLSVIGSFTDEEMACIRTAGMKGSFYKALLIAAGRIPSEDDGAEISGDLRSKCEAFLEMIEKYRKISNYTPIHSLIEKIINELGYDIYAQAKGGSASRNLNLLIKKAEIFEKSSYKGIFFFLRYIEKLKKYDMDFGEAKSGNEGLNAVRIMSIHKSKGLEFPVIFIGGMSKSFNASDRKGKLIRDSEIGIGIERTDAESRIKYTVPIKNIIVEKKRRDEIGEELRILYVGMTRAKEKLIMTAVCDDPEKILSQPAKSVSHANSYLDFMIKALESEESKEVIDTKIKFVSDMVYDSVEEDAEKKMGREFYEKLDLSHTADEKTEKLLKENLSWKYPHEAAFSLPAKLSVSRIKEQMRTEEEMKIIMDDEIVTSEDLTEKSPEKETEDTAEEKNDEKSETNKGAEIAAIRGTAYHKSFELSFSAEIEKQRDVFDYLKRLVREGHLTEESANLIYANDIFEFTKTDLYQRMKAADKMGKLFKEQPFIIEKKANEINEEWPSDETVQIQGIIDAFFIEDNKIYLVDYKTDRGVDGETLINRYKIQLDIYADALSSMLDLEIGEKIIYSVFLKKAIVLE
ncbi:MAG: helicase-exonuclease AddAB subunit AddA [Lachnospiraceae bacterium]|nr:helicase-exonuclease AddAB subunit AddA [Lachnospiraceae bacterium]